MPTLFVKAGQHRIFQDIVEQIQSAIFDGSIPAGEKLPPERELVDMFETSGHFPYYRESQFAPVFHHEAGQIVDKIVSIDRFHAAPDPFARRPRPRATRHAGLSG